MALILMAEVYIGAYSIRQIIHGEYLILLIQHFKVIMLEI